MDLWDALENRAWEKLASLLDPEFTCTFPQSGEEFSKEQWLHMNRDYPGDWHIDLCWVLAEEERVVSEVSVTIDGRVDTALSIFDVCGAHIISLREFWPEPFEPPDWRRGE